MADRRGCKGRASAVLALGLLAACDGVVVVLWMLPELVTLLGWVTLGLAFFGMLVLPTVLLYANPVVLSLAVRHLDAFRPVPVLLLGVCSVVALAVAPGLSSRAVEATSIQLAFLPSGIGEPPRSAPKQLRLVRESQVCDALCMQLLFGGEVDALELSVEEGPEAGSTVYRRTDQTPCPPWSGARPRHLNAFEQVGECLQAEPGGSLDGPWLRWTERVLLFSRTHRPRQVRIAEGGEGAGQVAWRAVSIDRQVIRIPTHITLVPAKKHERVSLGLGRSEQRDRGRLPEVLREAMGHRVTELSVPSPTPFHVVRHYLGKEGPLRADELSSLGSALNRFGDDEIDEELLEKLLTDPRMTGRVYGALADVAGRRPEAFVPHVERIVEMVEDGARDANDRTQAAKLLGTLRSSDLVPFGARIVALAEPPSSRPDGVRGKLLPVVGRLDVDPASALGPPLAGDDEQLLIAAAGGLCNADAQWAEPHLDAAGRALQAGHGFLAASRLARALVRHGRAEVVEAHLATLEAHEARRMREAIQRTWPDPPGGCWR